MTLAGSDTVRLVFRDAVLVDDEPVYDGDGRPTFTDRFVPKSGVKFTIESVTPSPSETFPPRVIYSAKVALEPDTDTLALLSKDAIEHDDKVYELSGDPRPMRRLLGGAVHHVRARCTREEAVAGRVEQVTVTPRGAQDDDGVRAPDGVPFTVDALAVDAGNTAQRYGATGTVLEADFTVALSLGVGVRDGDWIRVRGRDCVARVQREFSEHADRNVAVVLARSRTGG